MSEGDLYAVLRVDRTATKAEIVRAYRRLVRRYHPDTRSALPDGGDQQTDDGQLQRVMTAHAVLADPVKRSEYDHQQRRHGAAQHSAEAPPMSRSGPTPVPVRVSNPQWDEHLVWLFPPAVRPYYHAPEPMGLVLFRLLR